MAQHHFVVVFDDENEEWFIDYETLNARFDDGQMYDFDEDCWVSFHDMEPHEKDLARALSSELRVLLANARQKV